jgi:hypothetical protein
VPGNTSTASHSSPITKPQAAATVEPDTLMLSSDCWLLLAAERVGEVGLAYWSVSGMGLWLLVLLAQQ